MLGIAVPLPHPVVALLTVGGGGVKVPGAGLTICTNQDPPGGVATVGLIVNVHVYTFGVDVSVQVFTADGPVVATGGVYTTVAQAVAGGKSPPCRRTGKSARSPSQ